jgi:SAM-dependent methyltransferase
MSAYFAGEESPNMTLFLLCSQLDTAAMVEGAIRAAPGPGLATDSEARARLLDLLQQTSLTNLFALKGAAIEILTLEKMCSDPLGATREFYEHAAANFSAAGVAGYCLGSTELLDACTEEVVGLLGQRLGVLGPETDALEIGCGIGRFLERLSPLLHSVIGTDISGAMVEASRRRCAGLTNVSVQQIGGRDLASFSAEQFGLVLIIDAFPHIHSCGLANEMLREISRVLRVLGHLVVANYSYTIDVAASTAELGKFLPEFEILRAGERLGTLWDGRFFHLQKRRAP